MKLTSLQKTLWAVAVAGAIAFGSLLLWADYRGDTARQVQDPAFRADFKLTDHQGAVRTEEDFAGRWLLVFFGFTNCPDVCPTTLAEVAAVMDGLGAGAEQVAQAADSFHIYCEKIEEAAAPDGYTMGHSSQLFLFDPSGGYAASWQYGTPAEEILADLTERIAG